MPEPWTGEIIADLHINRIHMKDLAKEAGYSVTWVSNILNGVKTSRNAEKKLRDALDAIKEKKNT